MSLCERRDRGENGSALGRIERVDVAMGSACLRPQAGTPIVLKAA